MTRFSQFTISDRSALKSAVGIALLLSSQLTFAAMYEIIDLGNLSPAAFEEMNQQAS